MQSNERQQFLRTMWDLIDNQLEPATAARLQTQLAEDREARQMYVAYLDLTASLRWRQSLDRQETALARIAHLNLPSTSAAPSPLSSVPSSHRPIVSPPALSKVEGSPVLGFLGRTTAALNRPAFWATLAAGVLFAGYVVTISWNMLGKEAGDWRLAAGRGDQNPTASAVATISNTADAQWANQSEISNLRSEIAPGQPLAITAGTVELQLKQGTTLIVKGPAEWSIDGDNNATLKHGKLVAKVPQQAVGFTIETPAGSIVDLGTEFGAKVERNGNLAVEVYRGKVRVDTSVATTSPKLRTILLSEHKQRRVEINVATGGIVLDGLPLPSDAPAKSHPNSIEPATKALLALMADSPRAIWRISQANKGIVWNEIGDQHHGKLVGNPDVPGTFDGIDDCVQLPNLVGDNFSIELCFRTSTPGDNQPWTYLGRTLVWADVPGVNPDFAMSISSKQIFFYSCVSNSASLTLLGEQDVVDDRWHHVMLTRERDRPQGVKVYVDGILDATADSNEQVLNANPIMTIGGAPLDVPEMSARRYFVGELDIVAVYNHVLDASAAKEHSKVLLKLKEANHP